MMGSHGYHSPYSRRELLDHDGGGISAVQGPMMRRMCEGGNELGGN